MRFAVAHKVTSYAMVAAGLFALIAGGSLSPVVVLLSLLGLVVSWWWEPPRVRLDRWTLVWNVLTVLVFVWCTADAVLVGDWFGSAASFLVWLVIARAFNRRTSKDWQQMYLLSFLMLVTGSVLNEGLTYAVAFLAFVIASTWAMILSHLRREMEDNFLLKHADASASERVEVQRILQSRRIVGGRFFAGTGLVSVLVFVLSGILFVSIPRVGAGFFVKRKTGLTFAGFSDGVKLGGHGTIKTDSTVVMRVEVGSGFGGRAAPYIHWRGAAFDEYSEGEWRRSKRAPHTESIDRRQPGRQVRRHPVAGIGRTTDEDLAARVAGAVKQTIYLEPLDSDVLFGASTPVAYEHGWRRQSRANERNDDIRLEHSAGIKYTVWSDIDLVEERDARTLRAAPKQLKRDYDVYLQLPPEITPRTRELAAQITAGLTNDYDRAAAIERWLRESLAYTLDLEDHGAQEPIDFFLFDRRKGHCEYFASAFAILARSVGIPTRQVNGFLGGEWNEYDDYIAVRAGDAHSWNEVYFAGVGWVTFDATPPAQDRLGRGGTGLGARLRRLVDTLRFQWFKWVIEYDLGKQLGVFKGIGNSLRAAGRWLKARWRDLRALVVDNLVIALGLAAAIAALIAWRLVRRRRRRSPEERARPRHRGPIATAYSRVLHRMEKRGVPRAPSMTPRELARDVAARRLPWANAFGELTELYYAAQWGGAEGGDLEARARALAAEIEAALDAVPGVSAATR
jgi:hypothetical protein